MAKKVDRNCEDFQAVADAAGQRAVESMRDDLAILAHSQECSGTSDGKPCEQGLETECPKAWHDEDEARRHIEESPLSVEVRGDWHTPGSEDGNEPTEYNILLGTGGPAARIIGELEHGQPSTARFEYQDWFKPWTAARLSDEDEATLLEWAQQFYFGE